MGSNWIKRTRAYIKDETHWAKIRDEQDKTGEQYIDVLVGVKGDHEPHAHIGINLDNTRACCINPLP